MTNKETKIHSTEEAMIRLRALAAEFETIAENYLGVIDEEGVDKKSLLKISALDFIDKIIEKETVDLAEKSGMKAFLADKNQIENDLYFLSKLEGVLFYDWSDYEDYLGTLTEDVREKKVEKLTWWLASHLTFVKLLHEGQNGGKYLDEEIYDKQLDSVVKNLIQYKEIYERLEEYAGEVWNNVCPEAKCSACAKENKWRSRAFLARAVLSGLGYQKGIEPETKEKSMSA